MKKRKKKGQIITFCSGICILKLYKIEKERAKRI